MTDILMPKLADSMEHGLVRRWLIRDGAEVGVGDELLEIETDKATMTYESEVAGKLSIVVDAGTTVPVGDVIATVGAAVPAAPGEEAPIAPGDDPILPNPDSDPDRTASAVSGNGTGVGCDDPLATPVARRLAAVHGITLALLQGSGPRGRIMKSDVLSAAGIESFPAAPAGPVGLSVSAAPPAMPGSGGRSIGRHGQLEELSRPQQLIARRMAEAKSTIPHFQVQTEVAMDRALELRAELKMTADTVGESAPSVNDVIVKACAVALRSHPHANGSFKDGRFELHDRVNVGIAVATEGALVVPTVFDADNKSLARVAGDTRALAARVRDGSITPGELSGATFTVSNLGMFGMTAITPVINPPQAAILGVGAVRETLARDPEGAIVDRSLLTLTLSCDHRILYGADAAGFLAEIKALVEAPLQLAFG